MRALSLKQPFAELILQGKKTIELRKWNTKYRGDILIHSTLLPDADSMKKFGFESLPCGFILGKVRIVDVKKYNNEKEHEADKDKHLADSFWGNYGFVLKDVIRFTKPVPAKGSLGFWEVDFKKENFR